MKRKIVFIMCMLVVCGLCMNEAVAQERAYEGTITIVPVRLEQQGKYLHIELDFALNSLKVKSAKGVDFIPQLVSTTDTCNLPQVSIKGRDEYLAYERRLAVMSAKEERNYVKPYMVEKGNKRRNDTLHYHYTMLYKPWMAEARLYVQRDECGCGETASMGIESITDKVTLEHMPLPYVVTPHLTYVEPAIEKIKNREMQVEAFLDFEVNKVDIRPGYMNNPQELAKIHAMIDELKSDSSIVVKRLDIIGYASPEGTLAVNKRLSEGRAVALRSYLSSRYGFPRNLYHIVFGGENWEGLTKVLRSTDWEYKAEMLEIIETVPIESGRESKLMQLHGGAPYRYLLKNVFPGLRVAICKANYEVRNFNVAEAREMIKKRPQNLSLNEMFLLANSYPGGSREFIEVFETAVRLYPESGIANINAAAAALSRKDTVSAERYLARVKPKEYAPEYNNAMGVLALLKGDNEQAEKYLETAITLGSKAAEDNLKELARRKENE